MNEPRIRLRLLKSLSIAKVLTKVSKMLIFTGAIC
jgi:hypothetical protein